MSDVGLEAITWLRHIAEEPCDTMIEPTEAVRVGKTNDGTILALQNCIYTCFERRIQLREHVQDNKVGHEFYLPNASLGEAIRKGASSAAQPQGLQLAHLSITYHARHLLIALNSGGCSR